MIALNFSSSGGRVAIDEKKDSIYTDYYINGVNLVRLSQTQNIRFYAKALIVSQYYETRLNISKYYEFSKSYNLTAKILNSNFQVLTRNVAVTNCNLQLDIILN